MYKTNLKVIGHHGTYSSNVSSILDKNFMESSNHLYWFGDGVYFFIEGVSVESSEELAKEYKTDEIRRDHQKEAGRIIELSVLQATIRVNDDVFLDLTVPNGNKLFNKFRNEVIKTISFSGKKPTIPYNDYDIFNLMRKKLGIEFIKADVYIQFNNQRKGNFKSNVPNVTIFVVNNPLKNIQKPSIKEVFKGGVAI